LPAFDKAPPLGMPHESAVIAQAIALFGAPRQSVKLGYKTSKPSEIITDHTEILHEGYIEN